MSGNGEWWRDQRLNPHAAQVYLNSPGYQFWVSPEFRRVLRVDSAPEQRYNRRVDDIKTIVHWGQRKLLLSEIEFLTMVGPDESIEGATVVYAGAAPGTHVEYLSSLFPSVRFVLVDPAPHYLRPGRFLW